MDKLILKPSSTHYQVLNVKPSATRKEIKAAYRTLSLTYHPDKSDHPQSTELFKRINEAYTVLTDKAKRKAYDEDILIDTNEELCTDANSLEMFVMNSFRDFILDTNLDTDEKEQFDKILDSDNYQSNLKLDKAKTRESTLKQVFDLSVSVLTSKLTT